MKRLSTFAFALSAAATLSFSSMAFAQDSEVELRFKKGVELYREADFRSAAVEFRRAYEQSKNFKILYNIAQCEYQLTDYVAALDAFNRYVAEGAAAIPEDRRAEVDEEIRKLRSRVVTLTVRATDGAEIEVDDAVVGTAPLPNTILLNPGRHRVAARLPGGEDAARTIDVGGGEAPVVELSPAPAPVVVTEVRHRSWAPVVVAWTATGLLAAGTVVLGLVANSKSNELKDRKGQLDVSRSELSDLDSQVGTFSLLTDVGLAASIMGAGISTYLTIDRATSSKRVERAAPAQASTSVRIAPTLGGVRLSGTF